MKPETEPNIFSELSLPMPRPHVLVVDDDPIFRALVRKSAERRKINATVCGTLRELDAMIVPMLFDVAVIDYYLDEFKERLKGTDLALVLEHTPVVLTSSNAHCIEKLEVWPNSIRKFINKRAGVDAVLDAALSAVTNEKGARWREEGV